MCLNKRLFYNIRVKSRICDLLVLRKTDFLKLSVNYKSFTEKFLKRSLYKYLKIVQDANIIMMTNDFKSDDDITQNNLYSNHMITNMNIDSMPSYASSSESLKIHSVSRKSINQENVSTPGMNNLQIIDENTEKENEDVMIKLNAMRLLDNLKKISLKFENGEDPELIIEKLLASNDILEKRQLMDDLENIFSKVIKKI